ncbi:putative integral membrane protein (TIGR00698 family) [Nocardioides salarius]|uniref:Integral membrane protein (TIGR00698 family) n=1 Tax=Nocardioides salarius TaxID=374513 RepID=A0ABS2M528_9ACTN|nr:putative sulfate exporter family transporter [Nocardioides salarius]MBM7506283.1 putative integral membrane protein (TIGR00698 family) [Nocardioides salarius]
MTLLRATAPSPRPLQHQARPGRVTAYGPPLVTAAVCVLISRWVPLLGPLLLALLVGAVVANSRLAGHRALRDHARVTRALLRVGVVALGLRLPLSDIAGIGFGGVLVVVVTVTTTYTVTRLVGSRTGLPPGFVTLLAAGSSICGAAAIAAVSDAVRARERDVAHAVALVTLQGTALIVLLPWAAQRLGLSGEQSATWVGASIHEVAQVAAAASVVGGGAIAVAMTVKLGRVTLLAPTYLVAGRGSGPSTGPSTGPASGRPPLLPWFLVGFVVMLALRSSGWLPGAVVGAAEPGSTLLLAAGMVGLGLGLRVRDLWPLPLPALALASLSTVVAAGTSLVLVLVLV